MRHARGAERSSWIVRDEFERTRFREMHDRLLSINARVLGLVLVAILPAIPLAPNPGSVVLAVVGIVFFLVVQRVAVRFAHPEAWVLVGLLGSVTMIIVALSAYGAARSPAMALCAWTIAGITGRYNNRVVVVSLLWTIAAMETAIIAPDPSVIWEHPLDVSMPVAALVAVATSASVLRDLDLASRGAAILDPLTGLLNRHALESRIGEIEHQSRVTGEPVGVVVMDLDSFKAINDTHGHATGDHVLRDVAYRIRHELGPHDLAYRLGGEEFAVLMPARGVEAACTLGEQLRAMVARQPIAGLEVRTSVGVAASAPGEPFAWDAVFGRADDALYEAKRSGRDRVVVADGARPGLAAAA